MATNSLLRTGLIANAALSLLTGIALTANPAAIAERLDATGIDGWLRALGISLLFHVAILAWVQGLERPARWVWLNLAVIGPYPFALAALAASNVVEPAGGKALLLLDAALVGTVAVMQWLGVRRHAVPAATATATA